MEKTQSKKVREDRNHAADIEVTHINEKGNTTTAVSLTLLVATILLISIISVYSQQSTTSSTVDHVEKRSVDVLPEYTAFKEGLKHGKLVCQLPLAKGNCTRKFTRFYYDSTSEHCFKFIYTGCRGNGNRFLTKHQCKQRCSPNFWKQHKHTKLSATVAVDSLLVVGLLNASSVDQKLAEASRLETRLCDQQECSSAINGKCVNGKCRCYKGFEMRNQICVDTNECHWVDCGIHSTCVNLPGSFRCECRAGYAGSGFNCTTNPAVCQQPFDQRYEKQCNAQVNSKAGNTEENPTKDSESWQMRFYYDWKSQNCRQFWYGGCQFGNNHLNFFSDFKTCETICGSNKSISQPIEAKLTEISGESMDDLCLDAFDISRRLPCSPSPVAQLNSSVRWTQRFYFDLPTKKCKLFWYDSICQHQTAANPLANLNSGRRKSRNVFVHLNTCKQACENPALGENRKTGGVIQAMFTPINEKSRYNLVNPAAINKSAIISGTAKSEHNADKAMEVGVKLSVEGAAKPNSVVTAHIEVEGKSKEDERRLISDDCLDKFDYNLKRACSKGRFPWAPRYYYDAKWKKCRMYWSDGACRSLTRNNFPDLATCKWKCESAQSIATIIDGRKQGRASCLDTFDHAYKHDCGAGQFTLRYYFNHQNKQCSSFQYGGCPATNGQPPSRNIFLNYEDCLQLCETPTKSMSQACSQPLDKAYRRPCGNHNVFSQYYYYDHKAEACRMFWYGNCKNSKSENIFSTLQSCQWLCEQRKEQKVPAHCLQSFDDNYRKACNQGKQWRRKYYFDHKSGQCRPFWYDGCLSKSQNIFPHLSLCKSLCEVPALPSAPSSLQLSSSLSTNIHSIFSHDSLRCLEPMNIGNCQNELPAYFYNKHTQQCEPFSYSGCSGNRNRFLTVGQCQSMCQQYSHLSAQQANCFLPLNVGFGRKNMSCIRHAGYRFYYNPQYSKCGRFWYFGCGGNENLFSNYAACERLCQDGIQILEDNRKAQRTQRNAISVEACFVQPEDNTNQTTLCSLEDQLFSNNNSSSFSSTKWTYSTSKKSCQPLEKTACLTGAVSSHTYFDSLEQCTSTCGSLKAPNSRECAYLPDWGPCNLLRYMWFYNLTKGNCEQFLWGGCGGNNLCSDKLDRGQWCESMTNRFYYHSESKTCKGFHYTGCGKSGNNFKSLEDCEQRCIHGKERVEVGSESVGQIKNASTTAFFNNTEQGALKYSGSKPAEKPAIQRHQILLESSRPLSNESLNSYVKAEGQYIDYGYCSGYRYNISGAFTRLTSYMCLMEKEGTCQVHTFWDTGGDEQCKVVRPWLRGTHYYTWFFIVDRRPYWRRPDGPPILDRPPLGSRPEGVDRNEKSYWDAPTIHVEDMTPPPIQHPTNTISSIIILPVNDCHSIC